LNSATALHLSSNGYTSLKTVERRQLVGRFAFLLLLPEAELLDLFPSVGRQFQNLNERVRV
jgi:hypothetical protein